MATPDVKQKVFNCDGYRYEIRETQVDHEDYDTLYLAWRQSLATGARSPVVLKRFPVASDGERRERAWEEVHIATYLDHPNITKVHCIANSPDRTTYVVMESIPGLYLLTAMDFAMVLGIRLSPAFCAYVAAMVVNALDYAHKRQSREHHDLGIIHRAVSPMSVRLGFDGRVKLGNFGSAFSQLRDRMPTPPGLLRGEAAYTAPEIWRALLASPGPRFDSVGMGLIDGKADVFSCGVMLLEMLSLQHPLDPSDVAGPDNAGSIGALVKTERPTWIAPGVLADRVLRFDASAVELRSEDLPRGLRSTVRRALYPDSAERIDAATMRDELLAYLSNLEKPFGVELVIAELERIQHSAKGEQSLIAEPIERTSLSPSGR